MGTWKQLRAHASVRSYVPSVGLQRNGRIAWNRGAQESLGHPQFVRLLLDDEGQRLGVQKAECMEEGAFAVQKAAKQQTWSISAFGALQQVGLSVGYSYRKYAQQDGDILWIPLAELRARGDK